MPLPLIITQQGRAAVINNQNTGSGPVIISEIALGSGLYEAANDMQLALQAEIKRLNTFGGDVVADDTIHVTITDETADTYTLGEFGLITDQGVLFAYYAQETAILEKASDALLLLSSDVVFASLPPGSVTIGGAEFMLPPATPERHGVIKIATPAQILTALAGALAITPEGLGEVMSSANEPFLIVKRDSNGNFVAGVITAALDGNAATATALQTARNLTVGGTAKSFNGGANVAWSLAEIFSASQTAKFILAAPNAANGAPTFRALVASDVPLLNQDTTGNAATATALQTSRTISLTGDVTGSASFNGTANASITATVGDSSHNHNAATIAGAFNAGGLQSLGTSGYQRLPGGLIIQWGTYISTKDAAETFSFPVAFPTEVFVVNDNIGKSNSQATSVSFTLSQFTVDRIDDISIANYRFFVIALGR